MKGIIEYFFEKLFRLILWIDLRLKILSFLERNHEISIFAWEKAQS